MFENSLAIVAFARRYKALLVAYLACCVQLSAIAQISQDSVRIGILNDQSGPYSALQGQGSVVAARMAVEDFGGTVLGKRIDVVYADHQNKPDVGATIARKWFDVDGVDLMVEVGNSAVALAVQQIAREKSKIVIYTAVATTEITGKQCSPTGFSWLHDSYAMVSGPVRSLLKQDMDTWYFIYADSAFGQNVVSEASRIIEANGGRVVGSVKHPTNEIDFASYVLQAQASRAKVVAVIDAGQLLVSAFKQAGEFGLTKGGQKVVAPVTFLTDVRGMGLKAAQGLNVAIPFYWDLDDQTRAFSQRFFARHKAMPTEPQAAVYSGVSHYLKAVRDTATDKTMTVAARMRSMPVNDFFAKNGVLRDDGRLLNDFYLVQAKSPAESTGPWDLYKVVAKIPPQETAKPLSESECPIVKTAR
ncbi:ABC transporter substrate-binding protein [Hydrogenophaga sp. BPS33]|uniref:ABC transporter substrate-binding protein n=1 Tax=Hydrogenophaga sp. BPS33 TaxID=2651974 RepID=UPI001320347F|nr:ABC transporter substrate-binding protein [Hydrogenophaga sp. BPS33]QHE84703.1 ABC transporter substrate-binding protein [Hydrogenophaga sp. BPS33]